MARSAPKSETCSFSSPIVERQPGSCGVAGSSRGVGACEEKPLLLQEASQGYNITQFGHPAFPIAFGDTGDRNLMIKFKSTTSTNQSCKNCDQYGQYLFRCSDKSGNYSKYASVVYTNDYVAVVKPK